MNNSPYSYEIQIPANSLGRDFIVGDLHGSYKQLMKKLEAVKFDGQFDRLFSVGDLIDRGEDSVACLELLKQPWFYAVMGNHEVMFLQYLRLIPEGYSSARDFIQNGGHWYFELPFDKQAYVQEELAPLVLALPYRICVFESDNPFQIVHAQWGNTGHPYPDSHSLYTDAYDLERCTWGRKYATDAMRFFRQTPEYQSFQYTPGTWVTVAPQLMPDTTLTYCGHTILPYPVQCLSHRFIDTGAYLGSRQGYLTLVEHGTGRVY